jgi:hypothetical protein
MSSEIMKFRVFALAALMCVLSLGLASAQTSAPDPNPGITARAKDWLHRVQTGDIDRSQLDATMDTAFTPDLVKQTSQQLAPLGDPLSFTFLKQSVSGDITSYVYQVTFKSGAVNEIFALDKDGKIAGIRFTPAQ